MFEDSAGSFSSFVPCTLATLGIIVLIGNGGGVEFTHANKYKESMKMGKEKSYECTDISMHSI